MSEDENRIQEIMKEKGCSRSEAENRLRSSHVAVATLNPNLFNPISQPQQPIEESEPQETVVDPLLEEKRAYLGKKMEILSKLEKQVDIDNMFSEFLAVPEWEELLLDYIKSIKMLLDGWADYYIYTVQHIGDKIKHGYEFYKDGKQVTVDTVFHTASGSKTLSELIEEDEKKQKEETDRFRNKGVATIEKEKAID